MSPVLCDPWRAALEALDALDQPVTDWEANFLHTVLPVVRAGRPLSPGRQRIVVQMAERYLSPQTAAELRGQLRLL